MTLEEIYYVGQTIAVFFLIVSILFAAWRIRINTKAVRGGASGIDLPSGRGERSTAGASGRFPRFFLLIGDHRRRTRVLTR